MTTERINIAIATDAKGRLWGGHFGTAPIFQIYAPTGELLEERPNPYGAGQGKVHEHHDDPKLIIDLLPECRALVGRRMGEESKRKLARKFGIDAVLTTEKTPEAALQAYLSSLEEVA